MTFNLKKSQIGNPTQYIDPMQDLNFVAAADKVLAMHPEYGNIQEFMSDPPMGMEGISNPDAVVDYSMSLESDILGDAAVDVRNTEMAVNQLKEQSKKPFNLKEAQGMEMPYDSMGLDGSPELAGDNLEMQQDVEPTKTYETHGDLNVMLLEVANAPNAFQSAWNNIIIENPKEADSAQAALKDYYNKFEMKGEEQHLEDAQIIHQFIYGPMLHSICLKNFFYAFSKTKNSLINYWVHCDFCE